MATTSSQQKTRSSSSRNVVVWEWLNEFGKWRPYSPEVVAYIDHEGQKSKQIDLGQVSADLKMYTVDITSLCQIRKGTGTSRPVRRVIYNGNSPAAQQVKWEFEGDSPGQWVAYDMEISACFEQAFHAGQKMLDLSSLFQLPYSVHFTTMQQVRINTGRTRKIQRTILKTPYPPAGKTPRCFSHLTTTVSLQPLVAVTSAALPSASSSLPSVSATPMASSSSSMSSLRSVKSAGILKKRQAILMSSSESDSDSDCVSLRTRKQLHKKTRHGQTSASGTSGRKLTSLSSVPSSTFTPASSQVVLSGLAVSATTLVPSASSQSQSAVGAASRPFPLPHTSLATSGPSLLALPLATYAQPLGANLSRGFAPMAHIPHSLSHGHAPSNSMPVTSQSQSVVSSTQTHSHGQSSSALYQPKPSHSVLLPSQNGLMTGSVGSWLNGSGNVPPSHLLSSMQYSSGAAMSSYGLLPSSHMAAMPMSGMLGGSSHGLPLPVGSSSSLPLQQPHGGSSAYSGPLTRNRLAKSSVFGLGGPAGTLSMSLGGAPSGGSGGFVPIGHMNGIHLLGGGLTPNMLPPAHNSALAGTSSSLHQQQLQQHHPLAHGLHQMHRHLQQVPSGLGSSGSGTGSGSNGYPFNLSSFVPTMGLNVLPQSSLFHLGNIGSGQSQTLSSDIITESLPTEMKIVLPRQKKTKHKPKTGEEVLSRYMETIPPRENEDCSLCCEVLTAPSGFGEGHASQFDIIQLNKCSHMFHRLCLLAMYDSSHKGDSLQCPTCKTIYGELTGNCPPGEMSWDTLSRPLPGHPHCGTIRITYYISPGIQGPEHPHPGMRFTARGFPRSGFLPDDNRGRKILKMLMVAFRRKLMFTVGTSATTGEADTVTWNEIHHKTEFGSNISGHGYPDPNYMDNVTAELALKGVTEQDVV